MKRLGLCLIVLVLAGCPQKKEDPVKPDPSSATAGSGAPSATLAPAPADAAPPATAGGASWSGSYSLAAGTLSIPSENKDYAGVKQAKDDPSKMMGDGTIELAVDAAGKITGTLEGAAGPALVGGSIIKDEIRCTIRRKDPKDDGLTGTLTATISGAAAEGKLSLAEANAAIVREGKVSLKKK